MKLFLISNIALSRNNFRLRCIQIAMCLKAITSNRNNIELLNEESTTLEIVKMLNRDHRIIKNKQLGEHWQYQDKKYTTGFINATKIFEKITGVINKKMN